MGTSQGPTRPSAKCCTWVRATPNIYTGWEMQGGLGGYRWVKNYVWPSNVHSQLKKLTASWAAPKQRGQQVKEGDSPSLLHTHEILSGILNPALGSSVQERHGSFRVCPETAHKIGQRDGTALLWGKAETNGVVVQPGEEKAMGRSNDSLLVLKEGLQERWGQTF